MRTKFFELLFISGLLFSASCKSPQQATITKPTQGNQETPSLSFSEKHKLDAAYTNGVIQKIQGNLPEAIGFFKKCLDIYPNHAASMYEIANIHQALGKNNEAIPYAQKAVLLDDSNEWYKLLLGKCLMQTGQFSEAASIFERLVKTYPDKIDNYFLWATSLEHAYKYKEAIDVYDKIEQRIGITGEISIQKQQLYLSLKQFDKAVAEIQKLINSNQKETDYYGLLANLYFQNNKPEKGLEICDQIFKLDPNDARTHLMLADYYERKGDDSNAFKHVKAAFENPDFGIDDKVKILINYFNIPEKFKEEKAEADTLVNILVHVHPKEAKSYSIQGDFFSRNGKNLESRDAYRKAIQLDNTRYPLWQQVLALDEALNDFDAMESESKQAIELFPSEPVPYLIYGTANYHKKKYKEAIEIATNGKDYVAGDKRMLAQFYSLIADCYNAMKDYKSSDANFEKALNLDPDNGYLLNNWSYYLTLRNDKLDKAEKMSLQANQLNKDNSSYEDTYAWILYKKKDYSEAKRWLERAMEHGGDKDGTVLEHYGDVLFQLGLYDNALEFWKKAKALGGTSDLIDKKLNDKKLYE